MPIRKPSASLVTPRSPVNSVEQQRLNQPPPRAPASSLVMPTMIANGRSHPSVHWGTNVRFDAIKNHALGMLWALIASKYSYLDSEAALNAWGETIGADSVTQYDFPGVDVNVPKLLKIEYPNYRIFVLRGTTKESQKNLFLSAKIARYGTTATFVEKLPAREIGNISEDCTQNFLGYLFEPFPDLAKPIFDKIVEVLAEDKGEKMMYLVGHSLGAAIMDMVVMRFAKLYFDLRFAKSDGTVAKAFNSTTSDAAKHFDRAYRGAYLFASPLLGYFGGVYKGEIVSGETVSQVSIDGSPISLPSHAYWPWRYYTEQTRHLGHKWDPVTIVPMSRRTAPFVLRWAVPGATTADTDCGRYGVSVRLGVGELEDEARTLIPAIPTDAGTIVSRANRYHTAGQLLRQFSNASIRAYPGAPTVWNSLTTAALELVGDSLSPWG